MKWRIESDTVELIRKKNHGEYQDASHGLIFIFWNYYEGLEFNEADS